MGAYVCISFKWYLPYVVSLFKSALTYHIDKCISVFVFIQIYIYYLYNI